MRRIIIILVILAVVVVGGYFVYSQFAAPEPAAEATASVNQVAVNTGVDVVSAEGQVVPRRHAQLSVLSSGEVAELFVAEGDSVQAGDPILRLDTKDREIALQQAIAGTIQADANLETAQAGLMAAQAGLAAAEVGVKAAEASLALVQAPPTAEQIAVSEASVAVAQAGISSASGSQALTLEGATEAQLKIAEAQLIAAQALAKPVQDIYGLAQRFDVPADSLEDIAIQLNAATANVNAAEATLAELQAGATAAQRSAATNAVGAAISQRDAAQAQLALLLSGQKPEQVAIAQLGVEQAMSARAEVELGVQQAQTAVTQAEAALAQAQAAVEAAQNEIEQRTLTAPFAGTIAAINVELGEIVSPGVPAVALADLDRWVIETTDLTELDVVNVAVGFPVEVRLDALPDQVLAGTVADIDTVSTLSRGDVTYTVTIELTDATAVPLRWGMTAFVDVDVAQ